MAKQLYQCTNKNCPLGDVHNPGHFTGGRTKEQVTIITGNPEPDKSEYGPGTCPNCGSQGKKVEPKGDPREVAA